MKIPSRIRQRVALRTRIRRSLALFVGTTFHRTSIADAGEYPRFCARAARDTAIFETFKRAPEYTPILEHLACSDGQRYLDKICGESPELQALFDRFRLNDRIGAPRTCGYGQFGNFSPTTLRYVNVLSDLLHLFGSLDGLRIIEIGGGYGGQRYVVSVAARPESYTLVDLDPVLDLQRKYLRELGVPNTTFLNQDDLDPHAHYDLVISNYAFSECVRRVQERYAETVLQRSQRGYITRTDLTPGYGGRSYSRAECLALIPNSGLQPPTPQLAPDEEVWTWGDNLH